MKHTPKSLCRYQFYSHTRGLSFPIPKPTKTEWETEKERYGVRGSQMFNFWGLLMLLALTVVSPGELGFVLPNDINYSTYGAEKP